MNPDWNKSLPKDVPAPSYAPPVLALGLMLMLWGLVTTWILSAVGLLVTGFASVLWLSGRDASRRVSTPRARVPAPQTGTMAVPSLATASPRLHRYAVLLSVWSLATIIA